MMTCTPNERLFLSASAQAGVREIPGDRDCAEIMQFYEDAGHGGVRHETTAWCAAFLCAMSTRLGMPSPQKLNGRAWLKLQGNDRFDVQMIENIDELVPHDIIVLWRSSRRSWKSHVGILSSHYRHQLHLFGGNQKDKAGINAYASYRFLRGIRIHEKA